MKRLRVIKKIMCPWKDISHHVPSPELYKRSINFVSHTNLIYTLFCGVSGASILGILFLTKNTKIVKKIHNNLMVGVFSRMDCKSL